MGSSQLLVKPSDRIIAVSNVLAIALWAGALHHRFQRALCVIALWAGASLLFSSRR